ncbi:MAG: flagellar biosynthesis protein FlhA [Gammaproteobacteria bacterium 39-13]|nr:flagellar biosynthesis protein FlhA [Gammaproteobacteria bacterium]OJV86575.1 MAG: flagellar biosynthesis protein FlhA [Gammaproteobacteria bacterium 39-13]
MLKNVIELKPFSTIGIGIPIFVLIILGMMILPLPPFLLDIFFTFNITLALMVLLAGTYSARPLDFSIFPMILLLATLLRLALNIASTRVVLLQGHTGTDAAGKVVQSFGEVVIGGNYAVGFVVFLILVIINFIVVTKGASRISEVSARFTLDSMPGKQMAIDADLNSGIITQEEARERRKEIASEADFYGAMDGASKFVRGDAIAGILILVINIIGGFIIGTLQHDLDVGDAFRVYGLLTIGDGLVAQIPSLLLSTAAAIMVTRVSSSHDVSTQVKSQVFYQFKPLAISSIVLGVLGLIPGMPHVVFLGIAILLGFAAFAMQKQKAKESDAKQQEQHPESTALATAEQEVKEVSWDDVPLLDDISLEVGYKLIPLVESKNGGELLNRIKGVRKKLSQELGFLVPSVHIRDDLNLGPTNYKISLLGVVIGEGDVFPDKDMAINSGQVFGSIEGIPTKDPAFGLDAMWINRSLKEQAQTLGYTVVDTSTVIATHLSQILQDHAYQLLGHQEAQKILDILAKSAPKLVDDLVPDKISLSTIVKIFQNLLEEHVPLRDSKTIVETLSEYSPKSQDPAILTELVRASLGRLIVQQLNGSAQEVPVVTLEPNLEQILLQSMHTGGSDGAAVDPTLLEKIQKVVMQFAKKQETMGTPAILVVHPNIRRLLSKLLKHFAKNLSVLSFKEIPDEKQIKIVSTLGF